VKLKKNKVFSHYFTLALLQKQDFLESNLITADHVGKNRFSVEIIAPAWF
jgi:hypothetical protein